jgi:hypothetical protein
MISAHWQASLNWTMRSCPKWHLRSPIYDTGKLLNLPFFYIPSGPDCFITFNFCGTCANIVISTNAGHKQMPTQTPTALLWKQWCQFECWSQQSA